MSFMLNTLFFSKCFFIRTLIESKIQDLEGKFGGSIYSQREKENNYRGQVEEKGALTLKEDSATC